MTTSSSMLAALVETHGGPFNLREIARPAPGAGEVLVRVAAAGTNPLDTKIRAGEAAHARHPLYAVEMITIIGTALQFVQPWAMLVAIGVCVLLVIRSVYEEGVLSATYPDYAAYRAKTRRFVPGLI